MPWLIPSVIATATGTAILTVCYYYLYSLDRKNFLKIWAISWAVYFTRYVFLLVTLFWQKTSWLLIANQLASLLSGVLLLYGTYLFINKKFPRIFTYLAVLGGLWIFVSVLNNYSFLAMSLPTFSFLASIYVWTGIVFLQSSQTDKKEIAIVGIGFILWGVHKADYPFLQPVVWFAPWGYLLAAAIEFTVALGLLLVYFRKARNEITASEEKFRSLAESSRDYIMRYDRQGRHTYMNPAALAISGLIEADIIGKTHRECGFPEELCTMWEEKIMKVFTTGKPYQMEFSWTSVAGPVYLDWQLTPEHDAEDRVFSVLGVARDITERKQAEKALRESEQRYRNIFDNVLETFYEVNIDGVILDISPSVSHLSKGHYKREDLIGKSLFNLYSDYADRKAFLDVLLKHGMVTDYEIKLKNLDGSIVDCSISSKIQRDASNQPVKIIGTIVDITDHKKAEEERKILQIQLQQAQKMEAIGTLAGGIAHDFNNILGSILGYAEMVQEDCPTGSIMRSDIDRVVEASHRAKELVKQILAFSRQAESEKIVLQPALIIKEALKMLRSSLPTTIAIKQDIDLEAGLILADPTQIHQVIVNLCTNAFHAMEETGGTLTISLKKKTLSKVDLAHEPHVQPGDFIKLSIGDTGTGISPEIQKKIFDPFFTTKEVGKGTGMGLAIIHGIAKKAGGFVVCKSSPGQGATFLVYLPVHADTAPLEAETTLAELAQTGIESILFIDDEEMLAEMGKTMLERLGYRVTVETNSIAALEIIQSQPERFDLVITDQTMPGMTGSDLARRILQIRPGLPIILCTGFSNQISEEKARMYGIKGFAMKPLAKKDLAALIRKVLDGE